MDFQDLLQMMQQCKEQSPDPAHQTGDWILEQLIEMLSENHLEKKTIRAILKEREEQKKNWWWA